MQAFTDNLRRRVEELGLSLAQAARRIGLSERRFANYAVGSREPDLATLLRIAEKLDTTPDRLLGIEGEGDSEVAVPDEKSRLRQQLAADARSLDVKSLRLTVGLVRTVIAHQQGPRSGKTRA
jgi:transcriptional regulator with XRE-family HTH domain